jgi:hypothetical protein
MKKLSWFSGVETGVAQEVARRRRPRSPGVLKGFMNSLLLHPPKTTLSLNP